MILNLENKLVPLLRNAKEIYIASALINKAGHALIKENLHSNCITNYVIGIDLPSSPEVLEELMIAALGTNINAKIYSSNQTYHPKVYIIRTIDDTLYAFVGSANTTIGGLKRNVEMTVEVENQEECQKLINWFNNLYSNSFTITQGFLEGYKAAFKKIKSRNASNYSDLSPLIKELKTTKHPPLKSLQSQFFNDIHFNAYHEHNWENYSDKANDERKLVKNRFKELHEDIYPLFAEFGMHELHSHYQTQNIVSGHIYREGFTRSTLDAMWLHYGYSLDDIPEDSRFILLPRIQIILRWDYIGIWLVIGKDNGSVTERTQLQHQLRDSLSFRQLLYKEMIDLGGSYWIRITGEPISISTIDSADSLNEILQEDDYSDYFIIGRDYNITDTTLSEDNIAETVLLEFQRLYPIYLLVKHLND